MSAAAWAAISAILTAMIGGPMMWMLKRMDNRNSKQHHAAHLERDEFHTQVLGGLERIEGKIDRHIEWHSQRGAA
jgi:hypothetical protein